ncbi:AraC family transcriptional regulator [Glycomyces tenuis]|uniref:AraC family transcriptional regulator n=1 Tax=Glycomyces tenuis TaxID=58116 RepID=UPI001B7FEBEC|nr:AraC family transcriptional regulator [Glycomyces tenuis]
MDPLSELLGGIRAEGAVFNDAVLEAPWVLYFDDRAPLTMLTMTQGSGVLLLPGGGEVGLKGGQTAVIRGNEPFRLADTAASAERPHTEYWITCFDTESCVPGRAPANGHGEQDATSIFVGAYRNTGRRHERLLRALPPALVIDEDPDACAWLDTSAMELTDRRPGTQALIDRLFDWGLVCTLRAWFDREGQDAPGWYRGFADAVVGPALEAVHSEPFKPWTVASLAAEAGVSRALFAKRFTEVMGEPPLSYLTEWRMERAEELLSDRDLTVAQVARAVGYADPFGFSAAFKRRRGQSPTDFRTAAA